MRSRRSNWCALLLMGLLAIASASMVTTASADEPKSAADDKPETPDESRSATFQAVEGAPGEQVPGGPLLVGAYGVILVALVFYVARLGALHAKNRGELERLSRVLDRARQG